MKSILLTLTICFILTLGASAQTTDCPSGQVCLPQEAANKLLDAVNQLVAAKDTITKLTAERAASDAVIASAMRVIEDYKALDAVHEMQIVKYKDMLTLYERVVKLYADLVERLEKRLNAPKSAWQRFVSALKTVATIAFGIGIGRGL